MKTKSNNYFITVMIVLLVSLSVIGCQNQNRDPNSTENDLDSALQESGSMIGDDHRSFAEITSAIINISDLHIKEDSGNSDVILQGPYAIEISSGIVNFEQVDMFTGTYKKVDLTFQTSNSTTLNGHSIIIIGNFVTADGSKIPFTIKSDFTKQIQLPLVNNGVTISENSTASISIVFDIDAWLNNLDFADAQITDEEIAIDNNNNTFLLNAFEANLSSY